jgi:hypothetical protein
MFSLLTLGPVVSLQDETELFSGIETDNDDEMELTVGAILHGT